MIRKRLGQILLSGIFTVCAAVILALADRVAKEDAKQPPAKPPHPTDPPAAEPPAI